MGENSKLIDTSALFKLSYGLFVLTTRDGEKDNGCIINTAMQITDCPVRISITVNHANYSCNLLEKNGLFNICVLSQSATMETFKRFGFQSGKEVDKFADTGYDTRTENGLMYLPNEVNCVISGRVFEKYDCGTHTIFMADVTECFTLSDEPSATYQYYFDHIKPKPSVAVSSDSAGSSDDKKSSSELDIAHSKRFICKICGYVYDGDFLPEDFICPICKHGINDFEELK